jgi:hypothetical protein
MATRKIPPTVALARRTCRRVLRPVRWYRAATASSESGRPAMVARSRNRVAESFGAQQSQRAGVSRA